MKRYDSVTLRALASDLELELSKLAKLEKDIHDTKQKSDQNPQFSNLFYESIALKFHNFYTGCERIFSLISIELNGGVPKSADWHRRLLERMTLAQSERRAVISPETAERLNEFLEFRHVVRNIYGFELKMDRVDLLLAQYPTAWSGVEAEMSTFVDWLRELAITLEQ